MQLFHTSPVASAAFDEPNLVSATGLVPVMALARRAGLRRLADQWMSVPTDKGANAGLKICSLVATFTPGFDPADPAPAHGRRPGRATRPPGPRP